MPPAIRFLLAALSDNPIAMACRNRDPLDLVSLRQLRYFSAAVRASSFNEAARACSISQPALSEQIALLESMLEIRLFDRTGGRAVPTQAARELERRIGAGLGELQSALQGVHEQAGLVSGLVRVGLVQSYGDCWVVPVTRAAQAQWPALSVTLRRRTAQALTEGVRRGDLDLAVSFDPEPHEDLEVLPCFTERFVAIGAWPVRSHLQDLSRLADRRLALLPSEYAMRRQLDTAFARHGLVPQIGLESDSLEDLVDAARHQGMVAILNAAAALSLKVEQAVPLAVEGLQRRACLLRSRHRYHTHAAQQLWSALAAGVPTLPARWAVVRRLTA